MDILILADGVILTEALQAAIEEKIGRIEQYAPRAVRARVRLRKVSAHPSPRQYVVRVLCELPGRDLSAEESGGDVLSALDVVAEKIERRVRKQKTKRLDKREHGSPRAREKM
jgi:putative sigma-54 modulation protein